MYTECMSLELKRGILNGDTQLTLKQHRAYGHLTLHTVENPSITYNLPSLSEVPLYPRLCIFRFNQPWLVQYLQYLLLKKNSSQIYVFQGSTVYKFKNFQDIVGIQSHGPQGSEYRYRREPKTNAEIFKRLGKGGKQVTMKERFLKTIISQKPSAGGEGICKKEQLVVSNTAVKSREMSIKKLT